MDLTSLTMLSTVLGGFFILLAVYLSVRRHNPRYPPCPLQPWPILGHLPMLKLPPLGQFQTFREQCGNLFSLYFGTTHVIILNGSTVIKEAFIKQGDDLSDRTLELLQKALNNEHKSIGSSIGDVWYEIRSTSFIILKNLGMGTNIMAEKIQDEVSHYIEVLDSFKGKPNDVNSITMVSVSNIICSIIIGKRFDYNDTVFVRMMGLLSYIFADLKGTILLNYFPYLKYIPGDIFSIKALRKNILEIYSMFNVYIKENENFSGEPTNFISAYLQQITKKHESGQFTYLDKQSLSGVINDIFFAATETTASTILWTFLYMINYPQVQEKAFREIEAVVGLDRTPTLKDKTQLNYLNAVIMKVQRAASIVPLTAPRVVRRDVTLGGYTIPKGAQITANLDSILKDKEVWGDDADHFRPERFICKDGKLSYKEDWLPFSCGRRNCPGEGLAKMELYLFIVSIIQKFEILPADPNKIPPITGHYGLTHTPQAFDVRMINRLI